MLQEVYIIDDKTELINKMKEIFKEEKCYHFVSVKAKDMEIALENIPTLIIVEDDNNEMSAIEICEKIRKNEDNNITPVIVLSSNYDHDYRVKILDMSIQQYILKPIDEKYFYYTVKNIIDFVMINRRISPLTGLPGNVQIQTEIKKRLLKKDAFAVMYFDLDNFKAYNDVYGFSNGDEVIKLLSRIIVKNIHNIEYGNNFIGHIVTEFDSKVVKYYTEEDVERGFVEVANRKGIIEEFPIVSLSIAVVEVENGNFTSPLEIGEVSAQVKHMAKEMIGSTYVINRRRTK